MIWLDEIRLGSRSSEPVSIEAAMRQDTTFTDLVMIAETDALSNLRFESATSMLLAQGKIETLKRRTANLRSGGRLVALTYAEVERGVLRGRPFIWVA